MQISFQSNARDVEQGMSDFARRQLPFALSLALNATAADVKRNIDKRLARRLDRPTPFTRRAFRIRRAIKSRLWADVFAMPIQAAYLKFAEDGGRRRPKARANVVPVAARLNKYGYMPRKSVHRAAAKPATFVGTPRHGGTPGIWQRMGRGGRGRLRLLVAFVGAVAYRPRLDAEGAAIKTARARIAHHLDAALRRAVATARR